MYLFDTYLTSRHKAFLFLFLSVNMKLKASKKLTKESYKWTFYRVSSKKVVTLWRAKSLPTFGNATAIIITENLLQSSLYYRMILCSEVLWMFRKHHGNFESLFINSFTTTDCDTQASQMDTQLHPSRAWGAHPPAPLLKGRLPQNSYCNRALQAWTSELRITTNQRLRLPVHQFHQGGTFQCYIRISVRLSLLCFRFFFPLFSCCNSVGSSSALFHPAEGYHQCSVTQLGWWRVTSLRLKYLPEVLPLLPFSALTLISYTKILFLLGSKFHLRYRPIIMVDISHSNCSSTHLRHWAAWDMQHVTPKYNSKIKSIREAIYM